SDAEAAGAAIVYRTRGAGGHHEDTRTVVETASTDGTTHTIGCRTFINVAGLGARDIAAHFRGRRRDIPEIVFAQGNFLRYAGALPFQTLIVPVGETLSGGGAFTIDTGGQGKFGPDLELTDRVDYAVDPERSGHFITSIQRFYPAVDPSRLSPNYSGIRPRL